MNVENADSVEVSGYQNTVTDTACNDGKPMASGYNNAFFRRRSLCQPHGLQLPQSGGYDIIVKRG